MTTLSNNLWHQATYSTQVHYLQNSNTRTSYCVQSRCSVDDALRSSANRSNFLFFDAGLYNQRHPQCAPLNMYIVAIVFKQKVINIHLKLKEFSIIRCICTSRLNQPIISWPTFVSYDPISQHSVWCELTCHNSLHWTVTKRGHNRDQAWSQPWPSVVTTVTKRGHYPDQAWSQFSLDARCNVTAQREQQYNETQSNFLWSALKHNTKKRTKERCHDLQYHNGKWIK